MGGRARPRFLGTAGHVAPVYLNRSTLRLVKDQSPAGTSGYAACHSVPSRSASYSTGRTRSPLPDHGSSALLRCNCLRGSAEWLPREYVGHLGGPVPLPTLLGLTRLKACQA